MEHVFGAPTMDNMKQMPGGLSTPPASPGKYLPESEPETADTQTTELPAESTTLSTSPMQTSLASLSCATLLSPDAGPRTNPPELITPELLAVGELVAAMKRVVGVLGTTFDSLGEQTERVASLAPALKASAQIKNLRSEITHRVCEQEMLVVEMKQLLEEAVKQKLSEELKAHIHDTVEREVVDRVKRQLNAQIPENLRQQIKSHKRQILEVQRSLHNSEARHHNSALGPTELTEELRPLLLPLPSAEQSPSTAKPWSVLSTPASISSSGNDAAAMASPLFPRDLKTLFALRSEEAQTLVKEYGLGEQPTPITPIVAEGATNEPDSRERNLNKFMAHIGVVGVQMHAFPACTLSSPAQSSRSTLIISVNPSI